MNLESAKKIYCVGIGGIGVSGLARLFLAQGKEVAGSDLRGSAIVEDLNKIGTKVFIGHDPKNLADFKPEAVVYSADINPHSPRFL